MSVRSMRFAVRSKSCPAGLDERRAGCYNIRQNRKMTSAAPLCPADVRQEDKIMNFRTPESIGVPSTQIRAYLEMLEANHIVTHDILMAHGDDVFFELYVPPFTKDFYHREYSVSKSIVSLAVGFALDDGLLSLDDPMSKYFEKELEGQPDELFRNQTVRNMLMMSTAKTPQNWFTSGSDDRVRFYFQNNRPQREPGQYFEYDSTGSFVLGALVERLTGKPFMEYLRGKLFGVIGVSKGARCLTCPGGHSWGDSACLMTARDLYLCARFTMNLGSWNGKQLLSRDYLRDATSCLIGNDETGKGYIEEQGYGYFIWKAYGEGFFFNGMGCQLALCVPEKDLILIFNGDNQGNSSAKNIILDGFYDYIVKTAADPLPEAPDSLAAAKEFAASMKLYAESGAPVSPLAEKIGGAVYTLDENPMGITKFRFLFSGRKGQLSYTNAQGDKVIPFGLCENRFGLFPQYGYADEIGSYESDLLYDAAFSAAWKSENELWVKVQVIDKYFGNLLMKFVFDGDSVSVSMSKSAEHFFNEYVGKAVGRVMA